VGIEKLKEIHIERMKLEEQMENTNDPILLHKFAQKREQIEYRLQKVWGFPEDSNYHRWWEVPKCTCPRLDNLDNYPTKYRNIDLQCPVHGKLPEKTSLFKRILKFLKIK